VPDSLRPVADAMFASAAGVLGTLAGRTVAAGTAVRTESDSSIRIDPDVVATVTRVPSADPSFVARYAKRDSAAVVQLMLGMPGGGELDALQLSIVAETVVQVSSAMGEALASETQHGTVDITSVVAAEAASFPAPPFATYTACITDPAGQQLGSTCNPYSAIVISPVFGTGAGNCTIFGCASISCNVFGCTSFGGFVFGTSASPTVSLTTDATGSGQATVSTSGAVSVAIVVVWNNANPADSAQAVISLS